MKAKKAVLWYISKVLNLVKEAVVEPGNRGMTSNGGSDNAKSNFCFRCTVHVKGKPCSLSHGKDGPNKGPNWVEDCSNLKDMEHRDPESDS